MNYYNMTIASDSNSFEKVKNQLERQFERLEKELGEGPYFNGKNFSLVDAAFAPLFMRIDLLDDQYPLKLYQTSSRVALWARALEKLKSVKDSVTSDFREVYSRFIKSLDSYYSTQINVMSA